MHCSGEEIHTMNMPHFALACSCKILTIQQRLPSARYTLSLLHLTQAHSRCLWLILMNLQYQTSGVPDGGWMSRRACRYLSRSCRTGIRSPLSSSPKKSCIRNRCSNGSEPCSVTQVLGSCTTQPAKSLSAVTWLPSPLKA